RRERWLRNPIARRAARSLRRTGSPSRVTEPASGARVVARIRANVVLPEPFTPRSSTISPGWSSSEARRSTGRCVNRFSMSRAPSVTAGASANPARRFLREQGLEAPLEVLAYQRVGLAGELAPLETLIERGDQEEVRLAEIGVGRGTARGLGHRERGTRRRRCRRHGPALNRRGCLARLPCAGRLPRALPAPGRDPERAQDCERRDEPRIDLGIRPEPGAADPDRNLLAHAERGAAVDHVLFSTLIARAPVLERLGLELELWIVEEHDEGSGREIEPVAQINAARERDPVGEAERTHARRNRSLARELPPPHVGRLGIPAHPLLEPFDRSGESDPGAGVFGMIGPRAEEGGPPLVLED